MIQWFCSNIYTNIFTLVTVVLSGIVSWIISAIYYRKGNRENLRISVVYPIMRILEDDYSKTNYNELCDLSKEYSVRYMTKSELSCLTNLLEKYKEVSNYEESGMKADILFSYFEYKLKKHKINVKPVPFEYEEEIVYYDYPPDIHYLELDLERIFTENIMVDEENIQNQVSSLLKYYAKESYGVDNLVFFDDYTLEQVLSKSQVREQWKAKFSLVKEAVGRFLDLKIAKKV